MEGEADLSRQVIGAAIDVHRVLGPGLLESAYCECLGYELGLRGIPFETEVPVPVRYRGVKLSCGYRIDFLVAATLVVEVKATHDLEALHTAQVITYLRLLGRPLGLLVNFNSLVLKDGIRRIHLRPPAPEVVQ